MFLTALAPEKINVVFDDISLAGDGPCSFGGDGPCSLRALYDSHAAVLHGNAFFSVQ